MRQVTPYSTGTEYMYPGRSAYNILGTLPVGSYRKVLQCDSALRQLQTMVQCWHFLAVSAPITWPRCVALACSYPCRCSVYHLSYPSAPPSTICTTAFCVQRSHAACWVADSTMWGAHLAAELCCSVCCWVSLFPNAMLLFTPGAWNIL